MTQIVFYEKPGCIANTRQKKLLTQSGHTLDVRNLLTEPWTSERLRPFFGDRPVEHWFNPSAPAVKSGTIVPTRLSPAQALAAMVADPILVRRPLMEVDGHHLAGFDQAALDHWIGLHDTATKVDDVCPKMSETAPT